MTAYHCGIRSNNAASLVAYWDYQTSTCGGNPDGQKNTFTTGSAFIAEYSPADATMVRLTGQVPSHITFSGWDARGVGASSAVGIHHPSVDEKRISFENQATTVGTVSGNERVWINDWDLGTTEPGSSGSPLYNQDHQVIGQLHGGAAACGNDSYDYYGPFYISFTTGNFRQYLDPSDTGDLIVNTLGVGPPCTAPAECDNGLYCDGLEICSNGSCQPGTAPCDDGIGCTADSCDEGADSCENTPSDALCSDGQTCTATLPCSSCGDESCAVESSCLDSGCNWSPPCPTCAAGGSCESCGADTCSSVGCNWHRRKGCSGTPNCSTDGTCSGTVSYCSGGGGGGGGGCSTYTTEATCPVGTCSWHRKHGCRAV